MVLGSAGNAEHQTPPQYTHVVLEANVDDMTGEFAAHAIAQLLAAGALDAWASPITMKKDGIQTRNRKLAAKAKKRRMHDFFKPLDPRFGGLLEVIRLKASRFWGLRARSGRF